MKKKKYLLISLTTIVCILILAIIMIPINKRRTIDDLISQLEKAINKHDIDIIINLYPDYCKNDVKKWFSQEKLNKFYNNVIVKENEDIEIQILFISDFDKSSCDNIMKEITKDYQKNIIIEDYQLVVIKYHDDFGESNLQVIKINGSYYLYFPGYVVDSPLCYFLNH